MKISKIIIKNLYGITEKQLTGADVELTGKNGTGKSSVIDAIRLALTNKSNRQYVIKQGADEGEIFIETDTGLQIDRKARAERSDYKSIKDGNCEIASPEAFLRDIFTPLQLDPVEFLYKTVNEQNAAILDCIKIDWSLDDIKAWFGEIPAWVDFNQNIIKVLNDIQSERGEYFQRRQNINHDIRNEKEFAEKIAKTLPENYSAEKYENIDISALYHELAEETHHNAEIEKAKYQRENRDNKLRKIQADYEIQKSAIATEAAATEKKIDEDLLRLQSEIEALKVKKSGISADKQQKFEIAVKEYELQKSKFFAGADECEHMAAEPLADLSGLQAQITEAENGQQYINEYKRMIDLQGEFESLTAQSEALTEKIEKARTLPAELLAKCELPIADLSIYKGVPLIHGLPISNLSDGEKLDLCVEIAVCNPAKLNIVLIDGAEKLATETRNALFEKCKKKGVQFIATRTTDDEALTVTEL